MHVREEAAPADGSEPLEWLLLTSLAVETRRDAERVLDWYRLRWRIEDWHRILKSGCRAEHLNLRAAERIERAVAIKAVIAWRLAAMAKMGRETPELPAEVLLSDIEIMALADFAADRRLRLPDNLGLAVLVMAVLGGHMTGKGSGPPGTGKVWEGHTRLAGQAQTYGRLIRMDRTSLLYQRLRPDRSCV